MSSEETERGVPPPNTWGRETLQKVLVEAVFEFATHNALNAPTLLRLDYEERRMGVSTGIAKAAVRLALARRDIAVTVVVRSSQHIKHYTDWFKRSNLELWPSVWTAEGVNSLAASGKNMPPTTLYLIDDAWLLPNNTVEVLRRHGRVILFQSGTRQLREQGENGPKPLPGMTREHLTATSHDSGTQTE